MKRITSKDLCACGHQKEFHTFVGCIWHNKKGMKCNCVEFELKTEAYVGVKKR